ncbi:MAG: hypothetical protein JWP00_3306 [Chloroflexi bacterium]|jgi:rubrerythrin|nr:hypothetical protein [Chloroflexota bacterium]
MVVWSYILWAQVQQLTPPPVNNDNTSLLGWIVGVILALVVLALVALPLKAETKRRVLPHEHQHLDKTRLEGLQESALAESRTLDDLEFDKELGIIEEHDYNELKQRSENRLETLREQIDQLQERITGLQMPVLEKTNPVVNRSRVGAAATTEVRQAGAVATKSKTGETGKFNFKAAIKEKLKCSECGTPFKPNDRFCRQCSAPLPLLCLNCGKEVTDDDRFCAGCGSAVNT